MALMRFSALVSDAKETYTKDGEEKQEAGYQITKNYFFNPFAIAIK